MSVTRGVVSRLEMIPVAISPNQHVFSVDMDCAIASGNSGGPVVWKNPNPDYGAEDEDAVNGITPSAGVSPAKESANSASDGPAHKDLQKERA